MSIATNAPMAMTTEKTSMQQTPTTQAAFAAAFARFGGLLFAVLLLLLMSGAGTARAEFGITSFDAKVRTADGSEETRAGAHPFDATTKIVFNTVTEGSKTFPDENVRDIIVDLPAGFVGNPSSLPQCSRIDLLGYRCPAATQVGVVTVLFNSLGFGAFDQTLPVFNLARTRGTVADFGFVVAGVPVHVAIGVRSDGDYGVTATLRNISSQAAPFQATQLTLWGVPADPVHDPQRGSAFICNGYAQDDPACAGPSDGGGHSAGLARRPFLSNPTLCGPPVVTRIRARSWQSPDRWVSGSAVSGSGPTDCDGLSFKPVVTATPDIRGAEGAAGLNVDLSIPQPESLAGRVTPALRKAVVTLPEGVSLNPSSADGLVGCTDAQVGIGTLGPIGCPAASKVGDVKIVTPLLSAPLEGAVYLGQPVPGKRYRIFLTAQNDDYGITIRLEGILSLDPVTGRVTATFDDNPQLPFSDLHVAFKGGPRGVLATPASCGTYSTHAELTSWAGQTVSSDSPTVIDQGCDQAGRFEPSLNAGFNDPRAGGSSPFVLELSRPNGQQIINGLDVTLPAGVLGNVGSVPQCAEDLAAAGTCGAASQVGRVTVAAGAGSSPLSVPQSGKAPTAVYLAGPYKGAPFSLSIVVPAQAGPFDLGKVVVRAALFVDPIDAHVTVISDPLPTILDGIPLLVQKIVVAIDRPGFMVSPTNCNEMKVAAEVRSSAGAVARLANRLQMAECAALVLKPKLDLSLSGKGQTTDGKHPAVTANLIQPQGGQANLKKVRVALPLSLALDPDNANGLCEFVDGSKVTPTCPKASIVGSATAITPILDEPLSGPVYFVKNIRKDPKSGREIRTLPKLVIPLVGQNGVKLTLTGTSNVEKDQLVTTFDNVPDAPVSSFKLSIIGGKGGILTVSGTDICKATQIADQQVDGQNNKAADSDVFIQTPSCPTKVISKTVGKTTVKLKVGGLGAGKVTVTGRGIRKTTKSIAKSTVATIIAKRVGRARPSALKVTFTPVGGRSRAVRVSLG